MYGAVKAGVGSLQLHCALHEGPAQGASLVCGAAKACGWLTAAGWHTAKTSAQVALQACSRVKCRVEVGRLLLDGVQLDFLRLSLQGAEHPSLLVVSCALSCSSSLPC